MHFRGESLAVPPPKADLGVPQLGLSKRGIKIIGGHLGAILLHLPEIEGDGTPCPPQAGDLEHLAIPKRQLREPWLNRALTVKEKSKLLKIRDTCLIKASTTTGSRLKFVPSAFRESSIFEDSLGTKLRELAMLSRGSLPTRLSQSCSPGGAPLLLHNDYGRDEPGDGGERRRRDRPNDVLSDMLLRLGQLSLHL